MANPKFFLSFSLFLSLGVFGCGSDEPGPICGGLANFRCDATEFCDYPAEARCGAGDQSGTCEPRPTNCDDVYSPVMGKNGQVYSNDCAAHADGVDDCGPAASI